MARERSLVSGLVTSLVAVLIPLVAFEIYLRATAAEVDLGECGVRSRELVWAKKPNCGGANAFGFRDYDYRLEKEEGVFRIILIGDSIVEGHRVEVAETFGKKLEVLLNSRGDGSFEVVHLARGGYTTKQELVLLREYAFRFDPDLIVWNYCLNDPIDPVYHPITLQQARVGYRHEWFMPRIHVLSFLKEKLFQLRERIRARKCPREYHRFFHCAYKPEIEARIREIAEVSRGSGVPILFVIHPIYELGAYKRYSLLRVHRSLRRIAEDQGLVTYDVLDAYRGRDVSEVGIVYPGRGVDVWHPSARGHTVIAEYLYEKLVEGGHVARSFPIQPGA